MARYRPEQSDPGAPMPAVLPELEEATTGLGFTMASDRLTGQFLGALAASKPGGRFLELGTGTGLATAWLLHGMSREASLLSIDDDASVQALAAYYLQPDPRLTLLAEDGDAVLQRLHAEGVRFDFIFADTWPGKYRLLEITLELLSPGGIYVVDDLLPQPNWPPNHGQRVEQFVAAITARQDLMVTKLDWSTGILVGVKSQ